MALVYLSLGSNIEREQNISASLDSLSAEFGTLLISSVYESEAVGFDSMNYFNLVVAITTELSVGKLSLMLKRIEDENGRCRREQKFSPCTLDIDILTYDDMVGCIDRVVLPRDEITKNAFVLQPLAELAPQGRHPALGESYQSLWAQYDKTSQLLWPVDFRWNDRVISAAG